MSPSGSVPFATSLPSCAIHAWNSRCFHCFACCTSLKVSSAIQVTNNLIGTGELCRDHVCRTFGIHTTICAHTMGHANNTCTGSRLYICEHFLKAFVIFLLTLDHSRLRDRLCVCSDSAFWALFDKNLHHGSQAQGQRPKS